MITIKQLGQIFQGWKNLTFKTKEVEDIALPRLKICSECPIRIEGRCAKVLGGCGCEIEAKVRCITCQCPKGKW